MMRRKTFKSKKKVKSARVRIRVRQFVENMLCMRVWWKDGNWYGGSSNNIQRNTNAKKENLCLNRVMLRKGWIEKC